MNRIEKGQIPSIPFLKHISGVFKQAGIEHALGGSGLLYALGISGNVNDWDLTTEADLEEVVNALSPEGVGYQRREGGSRFASAFRLVISGRDGAMDVIGGFAIQSDADVCRIPTLSRFSWNGVPVGSPEVWAVAYALMDRRNKADFLFRYVSEVGAEPKIVNSLLQEPLPTEVYRRIKRWPVAPKKKADHTSL